MARKQSPDAFQHEIAALKHARWIVNTFLVDKSVMELNISSQLKAPFRSKDSKWTRLMNRKRSKEASALPKASKKTVCVVPGESLETTAVGEHDINKENIHKDNISFDTSSMSLKSFCDEGQRAQDMFKGPEGAIVKLVLSDTLPRFLNIRKFRNDWKETLKLYGTVETETISTTATSRHQNDDSVSVDVGH